MTLRAITITGDFEDWELALFAKLMRSIERTKPEHTFSMAICDAEGQGLEEAIKLVGNVFPPRDKPH